MSRNWLRLWFIVLVLGSLALGTRENALAQVPRNPPPNGQGSPTASTGKFLMIPGLMPLSMEGVQRDISLTPDQKQQLKAVSDSFAASIRQLNKSVEDLPPEDQEKRTKEANERAAQLARNAQHKAEAILNPQQLKAVQKIAFELSATGALANPGLQEKLGLSQEQRKRLSGVYEKAGEKMQQLQRDTASQVMQLLDEDQVTALKKQIEAQQKSR